MTQSRRNFFLSPGILLGGAFAATALLSTVGGRSAGATLENSPKAVVDEVWQIVNREYVDGTFNQNDWQHVRKDLLSKSYSSREQAYTAIREALEKLQDPYTRFLDPKKYQALTNQTSGELSGIGIRMEIDDSSQIVKVVEPIENSPAIQSGIKAGDKILAIDGQSTLGMSLDKASALIRGEVGTPITLKLSREGKGVFEVTLKRAQIELPTVRYSLKQEGKMRVGYIHLEEFSSHAASQMSQAIKSLTNQKVDAFVLDLRGNPGGLLYASVEIAQMWFDRGAIVRTVDRQGSNEEFKANRSALTKLPLAVLVDKNSASASEILTGALKDNGRATVIGTQTFGKALVQSVHSLSDGSGLAVTVAHYYTPNGTDISHKGISPDVLVELTAEQRQQLAANSELIGTPADPQYAKAIATLANSRLAQTSNSQNPPNLVVPSVSNR